MPAMLACLAAVAACSDKQPSADAAAAAAANAPERPVRTATHLGIAGTSFKTPDGPPFVWRGITAFRLLDYIADKNEARTEKYLAWAESRKLTVVRVLAMGGGFMDLRPPDGRAALSRLLSLAERHHLYVEVVALAGTMEMPVNLDEHLTALGETLGEHPNALLEIANEPTHPSQAPAVGRPDVLAALMDRVPRDVPIALGSIEADEGFARGDYVTWHSPRDNRLDGWGHVLRVAEGADFVAKFNKPVISDEPIGAGPKYEAGRRDDSPARMRAAALLTRLAGMGATFHYDAGLQATVPEGRELECFDAWSEAWTLLPANVESTGRFAVARAPGAIVKDFDGQKSFGVFERVDGKRGWILAIGPGAPSLTLADGWKVSATRALDGAQLLTIEGS